MKIRSLIAFALTLSFTLAAYAEKPVRRTVVVRDGKVVSDTDGVVEFHELIGKRAYLGVRTVELTPDLREHYGAPKDHGLLVGALDDNSPAVKAGVRIGDIVLSVDGQEIGSAAELRRALADKKEGDSVRLEVLRGRTRQTLVASVVEREGPRLRTEGLEDLSVRLGSPEWRARVERLGPPCGDLQTRIKDLEARLKDLEKRLQK